MSSLTEIFNSDLYNSATKLEIILLNITANIILTINPIIQLMETPSPLRNSARGLRGTALRHPIVIFKDGKIWLSNRYLNKKHYTVVIAADQIQDKDPISRYLNSPDFTGSYVEVSLRNSKNKTLITQTGTKKPKWYGVPLELDQRSIDDEIYTDISNWIFNYSTHIMVDAYLSDSLEPVELDIQALSTEYNSFQLIYYGQAIQFNGIVKENDFNHFGRYSVNVRLAIIPLPDKHLMIPRLGDRRIGYFYSEIERNALDALHHRPYIIINRRNYQERPWIFVIDQSVDKRYWRSIKTGVLQWNDYFRVINVDPPLLVLSPDDETYPKVFNIFDAQYNYIVNHNRLEFNGGYSGLSQDFVDYRTGEILFGNIYIDFDLEVARAHRYFYLYQDKHYSEQDISKAINRSLSWIVGHEMGHQLGLRHNFLGNETDSGYGSIMDYIDFYDNYSKFVDVDIHKIRSYDLAAIAYGYIPIKNERIDTKLVRQPDILNAIASLEIPFKTDFAFWDGILVNVGQMKDDPDMLSYINRAINTNRIYRQTLANKLKTGQIDEYQFVNGFIYIYANRFFRYLMSLCKYIGGKYIEFRQFKPLSPDHIYYAISLILKIKQDLKYTDYEYNNIIYDFSEDLGQVSSLITVEMKEPRFYEFGRVELFTMYSALTEYYLERIIATESIIRMSALESETAVNVLYYFTFCTDGVFPEIGMLINGDKAWITTLTSNDRFDRYAQHAWVETLIATKKSNTDYFSLIIVERIFSTIKTWCHHIIEYLNENENDTLLSHWNVIIARINEKCP